MGSSSRRRNTYGPCPEMLIWAGLRNHALGVDGIRRVKIVIGADFPFLGTI